MSDIRLNDKTMRGRKIPRAPNNWRTVGRFISLMCDIVLKKKKKKSRATWRLLARRDSNYVRKNSDRNKIKKNRKRKKYSRFGAVNAFSAIGIKCCEKISTLRIFIFPIRFKHSFDRMSRSWFSFNNCCFAIENLLPNGCYYFQRQTIMLTTTY